MDVICVVLAGWRDLNRCGHGGVGSWRRMFLGLWSKPIDCAVDFVRIVELVKWRKNFCAWLVLIC